MTSRNSPHVDAKVGTNPPVYSRAHSQKISRLALHRLALLSTGIGLLCAGIYIDRLNNHDHHQKVRTSVLQELSVLRANLEGRINSNIQTVQGLVAVIESEPNLNQARFAQLAAPLLQSKNQLRNIGAAPDFVLQFIYPVAGNEAAIGLNYRANATQWPAVERALATGELVVAGPVKLVQGGEAFIGRLPVFNKANRDGQKELWGLVSAVLDAEALFAASGIDKTGASLQIAIRGRDGAGASGEAFFGDNRVFFQEPVLMDVSLPHGSWQIAAHPQDGWPVVADNAVIVRAVMLIVALSIFLPVVIAARLATNAMQTKKQLGDSQRELERFFSLSNNLMCIANADGNFEKLNPSFAHILGYQEYELLNTSFVELIHPDDVQKTLQKVQEQTLGQATNAFINRYRSKDGNYLSLMWHSAHDPVTNKLYASAVDVTNDIAAQAQLEQSRRELQKFFDLSNNLMCIANLDGYFEKTNAAFEKLLGYSESELQQQRIMDFIHPEDVKPTLVAAQRLLQGKIVASYINRYRCKDGSYTALLWNTAPDPATRKVYATAIDITQQQETEQRLAHQQELLLTMSELARIGVWEYDRVKQSVRWSDMTRNLLKVEDDYSPRVEELLQFYTEDDQEKIANAINQALINGTPWNFEIKMVDTENRSFWAHVTGGAEMKDGQCVRLFGAFQDIHARKLQEQQIQKAHIELEQQMSLVEAIAHAQSNFIAQNNIGSAFDDLLNDILSLTESQFGFIGEIFYQDDGSPYLKTHAITNIAWDEDSKQFYQEHAKDGLTFYNLKSLFGAAITTLEPVIANEPAEDPRSGGLPEGHPKLRTFLAVPITKDNLGIGLVGIANRNGGYDSDIIFRLQPLMSTMGQIIESIRNSRARKRVEIALIAAKEEAESAVRAKSDFLATMSHEIRTPMNGVLGMLNLLQRSQLDEAQQRKVNIAKTSAQSLLALINDILDFSKVDANKMELESVDFDVRKMLAEVTESMAVRAQEKQLELILDLSSVNSDWLKGDPSRLRQVLTNLIGNAIKFTHQGEIRITAKLEKHERDWHLHVAVDDTGIGIPQHKLPTIFDPFTQADTSTTREYGGTGLGLAICKRICELMGGSIRAHSALEKGSRFDFTIRLNSPDKEQAENRQINLDGIAVLIVDDNISSAAVLARQLRHWQADTVVAHSAARARQILAGHNHNRFSLIFMDQEMVPTDGIKLAKQIHAEETWQDVPLVLMTSMANSGDTNHFAKLGFSGYFPKPATQEDLLSALTLVRNKPQLIQQLTPFLSRHHNKSLRRHLKSTQFAWPSEVRILLVEDNPVNIEVSLLLLEDIGLTCDVAGNGSEALVMLNQCDQSAPYTLILMDCQMPVMDGFETSRNIRQGKAGQHYEAIPIIALTANAMQDDQQRCLEAGMNDYLSKPVDEELLLHKLRQWLLGQPSTAVEQGPKKEVARIIDVENVWDQSGALNMLKGRKDRLKTLLNLFCESTPTRMSNLQVAVAAQNCEEVRKMAHAIKGSAAQLKGYQLEKIAQAMELAAKNNDLPQINYLYPNFTQSCDHLIQRFDQFLDQ